MAHVRTTSSRAARKARSAFTLIETALATIIIAVGVLALMEAHQTFLRTNAWSTHTSSATLLANELREMTRSFARHDEFSGGIYFVDPDAHTDFRGWGPEVDELIPGDFDDVDDLDGVVFGDAAESDLPGPIAVVDGTPMRFAGPLSAFAEIVPEIDWSGALVTDEDGEPLPLDGWTQYVEVQKVDPLDYTTIRPDDYYEPETATEPELEVDQFPLLVTVHTLYQGPFDTSARVIARHRWVVPR